MANIYRFRSIENLINRKEIEDQFIYFASPEQLNDPLEGNKSIYWSGDKVLWRNLIKHYISCLTQNISHYAITGSTKLEIKPNIDSAPEIVRETNQKIILKAMSNSTMAEHIEILSRDERKVRAPELICTLRMIHVYLTKCVTKELADIGLVPKSPIHEIEDETLLQASHALISSQEELLAAVPFDDVAYDLLHDSTNIDIDARNIGSIRRGLNNGKEWATSSLSFPDNFVRELEKLCYDDWYVACFMENCTNSAIWGTYGTNHMGVCLCFKTETIDNKNYLNLRMPSGLDRNGITYSVMRSELKKVSYTSEICEVDFFRTLGTLSRTTLNNNWYIDANGERSSRIEEKIFETESERLNYHQTREKIITTKLKDWENETEHRILLTPSLIKITDTEQRKIQYDFDQLEAVIFGIKTSTTDKIKIIEAIKNKCSQHHREEFNFYQARYNIQLRKIEIIKLAVNMNHF